MLSKNVRVWMCVLACGLSVWAQPMRPENLMVLVVGASSQAPDADKAAVVSRLQQLRQEPAWRALQMGTMHFDRPREAEFAQNVLGVQRSELPCLVLVQLDDQAVPVRKLYSFPRVTRKSLDQVDAMAQQWSYQTTSRNINTNTNPNTYAPPTSLKPPVVERETTTFSITNGTTITLNNSLLSPNKLFRLVLQDDGNMVLYRVDRQPRVPIWETHTYGSAAAQVTLGSDGILRMTGRDGNLIWSSHSSGLYGRYLFQIQTDGNAVIYRQESSGFTPVWATNTDAPK